MLVYILYITNNEIAFLHSLNRILMTQQLVNVLFTMKFTNYKYLIYKLLENYTVILCPFCSCIEKVPYCLSLEVGHGLCKWSVAIICDFVCFWEKIGEVYTCSFVLHNYCL